LIGIHSMITEVIVENRHVAVDVFARDGDRMEAGEVWGTLQSHEAELAASRFFGTSLRWRDFTPEVSRVVRDSPADRAGVRPGDILLKVDGQTFADPLELSILLAGLEENHKIEVTVERSGRSQQVSLTTGTMLNERELAQLHDDAFDEIDQEHYRELKNQLTSFRRVGPYEKRSTEELDRFEPIVAANRNCTVELREFGRTLTLGTIMSSDGYILTKASELQNAVDPECILSDGRRLKIQELATDYAFDLMLIKVDARNLTPVQWSTEPGPVAGRMLISTDARGTPVLPGVVSVAARRLPTAEKGFLGVQMQMNRQTGEVTLTNILPGGAAERDGLKKGDVILSINNTIISDTDTMARIVGSVPPFQTISVKLRRDGTERTFNVALTPKFVAEFEDALLPRYGTENLGKFASNHNSGFPEAIQHDTDPFPNQCGGPVLDLTGKAIGLNIARAARITSYAIPAAAVQRVYKELRAKPVGLRKAS
ncbi:MAG: PDZ domain-containing protein, partial [Planctomycetaceae bacterium]|nr:PDZ domain-containing protein [Planctomycetaceae bacterium]